MGLFNKIKHAIHHTNSIFNHVGKSTKSIFDHVGSGVNSFLDHGKIAGVRLVGPGSVGSKALSEVSKGAAEAGSALGSAGKGLASFANNSMVQSVLSTTPIGVAVSNGLKGAAVGLQLGKGVARQVSYATKQKNYSGDAKNVTNQVMNNTRGIIDSAKILRR